jgi:hypothetical protein
MQEKEIVFLVTAGLQDGVEQIVLFFEDLELLIEHMVVIVVQERYGTAQHKEQEKCDDNLPSDTQFHAGNISLCALKISSRMRA